MEKKTSSHYRFRVKLAAAAKLDQSCDEKSFRKLAFRFNVTPNCIRNYIKGKEVMRSLKEYFWKIKKMQINEKSCAVTGGGDSSDNEEQVKENENYLLNIQSISEEIVVEPFEKMSKSKTERAQKLIDAAKQVINEQMSTNKASKVYVVPRTTLRRILEHYNESGILSIKAKGKPKIFHADAINLTIEHTKLRQDQLNPCSRNDLFDVLRDVADYYHLLDELSEDFPCEAFVWKFINDHKDELSLRKAQGLNDARAAVKNEEIAEVNENGYRYLQEHNVQKLV